MGKHKYPIGYKFNKLTIIEFLGKDGNNDGTHCYYKCQCECGKVVKILSQHIQVQKSCGCAPREMKKL